MMLVYFLLHLMLFIIGMCFVLPDLEPMLFRRPRLAAVPVLLPPHRWPTTWIDGRWRDVREGSLLSVTGVLYLRLLG